MGEAKRRGTYIQRQAQAIQRQWEEELAAQERRKLRFLQEQQAYSIMTGWQIKMSEERHITRIRRLLKIKTTLAAFAGFYGGIGKI